jgi:hypothetical protein
MNEIYQSTFANTNQNHNNSFNFTNDYQSYMNNSQGSFYMTNQRNELNLSRVSQIKE